MKRSMMLIIAMSIGIIVFAQSKFKNPEERAAIQSEKMRTALALSDVQYSTIKEINKKYLAKHVALKNDSAERSEKYQTLKSLHQEKEKEIQAVLNAEQKTKWETYKQERAEKRKSKISHRIEKYEAKMKSELALSDDQFTKIQAAHKNMREKLSTLKTSTKDGKAHDKAEVKNIRGEYATTLKSVLTEEQFKKWTAMKAEMKNKRHHKRR
jgi:hypothetical protein